MFALVDCNSFFCSVEKVFHPGLDGKPLCVLSSNDGCIVALTPEAKAVGLRRGDPLFKVKDIVKAHDVRVFSSNMYLYAAMSRRITSIMRRCLPHVEKYSIDESFCDLRGCEKFFPLDELMRDVANRIKLWTDVPVSVGIAPTKTLAKMGSKFAKQYKGYRGVCLIDSDEKRRKALEIFPLEEVWGIGRRTLARLNFLGVTTTTELANKSEKWVRTYFTKPVVQTWMELNGESCIDTAEIVRNKSLTTSRSFGKMVRSLDELKTAVAHFTASCANKLRGQRAVAKTITVFVCSNRFREDLEQYADAMTAEFVVPTSDTIEMTQAALGLLERLYKPGIWYKKSGVIVGEITDGRLLQGDLFDPVNGRGERLQLMKAIDSLNQKYGLKTVKLLAEGEKRHNWDVKSEHRSGNYLTTPRELLTLNA